MKKNTHIFYISVIVILFLTNITLYLGKKGRFDAGAAVKERVYISQTDEIRLINLNTATAEELMTIKGIGEKTAAKIIARREQLGAFKSVEDLLSVEGIGENKFENFKEYVYVGK